MITFSKNISYVLCLSSILLFSNCVKELLEEEVAITNLSIIDASTVEIDTNLEELGNSETINVLAVNHLNDSLTLEGFSELPVRVSDLPPGYVYTFHLQLQNDKKRKTQRSEFGPPSLPTLASNNVDTNIDRIDLIKQINEVRQTQQTCGSKIMPAVAPLIWNDLLEDASELHAKDMAANNFSAGTNPATGVSVFDHVKAVNYPYVTITAQFGVSYTSATTTVERLIGVDSICESLMDAKFKEVGTFSQGDYWIQLVGSR